ncbi:Nucleotide-binding universal stress protein, UspA family [Paucidesulfovibrio gracilis DSM 16080]|uniref:Universal stress protein n=1 Tax=Paucidesulfovibrio gracilis DSM 16080 TaxID=1121449 RepID=A0A1T4W5R9_9BACT|nr:universal stress protein [Paucidesulfovibrio gracilis]SKA72537.1 Nucleotide-binding universal stress protein, UspA family [Paucidesulfovibrio gracilis DSM 16080]
MPEIKKILCAVDFSEHSSKVAAYTSTMARAFDAQVLCVYVAPSLSQYVGFKVPASSIDEFVGEIVTGAESTMEEFLGNEFQGLNASGKVLTGYAAEEVLELAKQEEVDMIVMGTHGRKGIDRVLFGSVAEKVVKSARCPVVTVRPD